MRDNYARCITSREVTTMARKKRPILNPHSYERIEDGKFYIGSRLAGYMRPCPDGDGYIWRSSQGFQAYDVEFKTAVRRMRNIFWYRILGRFSDH